MLELYFIRHGQSTNNLLTEDGSDTYLSQRSTDPDLTPIGEEQARLVAEAIARPYVNNGYDPRIAQVLV